LIISFLLTKGRKKVNNNETFCEIKIPTFLRGFGDEGKNEGLFYRQKVGIIENFSI